MKMKSLITILLLYLTSCTANMKILENVYLRNTSFDDDCITKFIKEKFNKTDVIMYKKGQQLMTNIMTHLSRTLTQSGYTVCAWTCKEERSDKEQGIYPQFVIYALDAQDVDYTLSRCIYSHYSAATEFIIITPSEDEAYKMLKVIQNNNISRLRSTVVVRYIKNGNLTYYKGYKRCRSVRVNTTFTYDCSYKYPQIVDVYDKKSLPSYLSFIKTCVFDLGVRDASPFVFPGNARQSRLLGLNSMNTNMYFGSEIAIYASLFEGDHYTKFDVYNVSDVHSLGTYNGMTKKSTGLLKELNEGRVDIVLGAIKQGTGGADFENTYPILRAAVIAVVQKKENLNIFTIFGTLNYQVWLVILFLILLFIAVISICFRRYSNLNISTTVMYLLTALLGKEIPIKKANFKLVFLSWITFSLFIRTSFEALSVQRLANKDKDVQIDSLNYLCENNFKIFVPSVLQYFGVDAISMTGCTFTPDRFVEVDSPLTSLANDTTGTAAAMIYESSYFYEHVKFIDDEGVIPFHVLKERVTEIPFVYLVRKGDLLQTFVQNRAMRALEAGLVEFIETKGKFFNFLKVAKNLRSKNKRMPLKLKHIRIYFYLYFFGIAVASITFVAEILISYFSK